MVFSGQVAAPPVFVRLAVHPLRWRLLTELACSDYRVRELVTLVDQPQNLVSYHLRLLRDGGLVTTNRSSADGRDTYYHLDVEVSPERVGQVRRILAGSARTTHLQTSHRRLAETADQRNDAASGRRLEDQSLDLLDRIQPGEPGSTSTARGNARPAIEEAGAGSE